MKELSETDLSYLAGFFDGDGCINISKSHPKHSKSPRHVLQVILAQANRPFLQMWAERTGIGKLYQFKSQTKLNNRQEMWHWRMTGQQAEDLLRLLMPFLLIKRAQADIAIEFRETKHNNSRGKGTPAFVLKHRDWLMGQLQVAKKY